MRLQFLPYNPSKDSYDLDETAEESPQQHAARVYHGKAKLLRQAARNNQRSTAKNTKREAAHANTAPDAAKIDQPPSSPVTILGAGRVDPFDAYCTSDRRLIVAEMLDHAISYQWTLFAADDKPDSLLNAKKTVMDTAIRFPVCFHALVYSGATHKAFHQSPTVDNGRSALLRLKSKGEALNALRLSSRSPSTTWTDGVIFAMTLLAILGHGEKVTSVTQLERRTLAAQQDGQFYASQEYEWRHWNAVIEVVKMKGGLHNIGFPGLAFAIASFDIHTSIMFQTRPSFPLFMPSNLVSGSWPSSQPGSPASQNCPTLAMGFSFLAGLDLPEAVALLDVMHGMRDLTMAFDSFQRGEPDAPPIKMIIFARNLNQHELLTLPDMSDELFSDSIPIGQPSRNPDAADAPALYELCRLGAYVFQMTVLLPNLHGNIDVTMPYARRIKRCLQRATKDLCMHENAAHRDLLLWVTLMTTWLVQDTFLYDWFLDFLVQHMSAGRAGEAGISNDLLWPMVRDTLATFLWLDSECAAPCAAIWEEVQAYKMSDERCVIC